MAELELDKLAEHFAHSNKAEGKSPRTITWYSDMLAGFIAFLSSEHSNTILSCFDVENARQFVVHEQQRGLSPFTVQGKVRALKAFASWLHREGYTAINVLADLKLPRVPQKLTETLRTP